MPSFEEAIHRIENEISVQKEDREAFTKDYDAIRMYLMDIMQQTDPVFKKIYAGHSLFGSSAENMKIEELDEFDVHFLLKLPFYEKIKPQRDYSRPGFVKLLISKPLVLMRDDANLNFVYEKFNKFVTSSKHLLRSEIHHWLEEIITTALKIYGSFVPNAAGTDEYILEYRKQGTAHNINARSQSRKISIDFVPAFRFNAKCDWFAEKPFPKDLNEKFWFAVPKPDVGPKLGRKETFVICVPQAEKHLLTGKYNLKPSLRLFKSIRDKLMGNKEFDTMMGNGRLIKSYFIRTVYMLENDRQDDNFWKQPPGTLLLHMVDRLLEYLENKCLPFYWCPTMNLMGIINAHQYVNLIMQFQNVREILEFFSNQSEVDYKNLRRLFGSSNKTLKLRD